MTGLVVITRPREEAAALADRLSAQGHRVLVEPMLDIVPLPAVIPPLARYGALVFTSANGVRFFACKSGERAMPAYAVGSRTAAALGRAGFTDIRDAAGDAQALAALIGQTLGRAAPVLHVAGRDVARDMAQLLAPAGIAAEKLTIYDAIPAADLSAELVAEMYARTVNHVLFFSVRTAGTFGTLLRKRGLADMVTSSAALCISKQVADAVSALQWRHIHIAAEPTSDVLTALLPPPGQINAD
jgi:uroporphyrinogen-III synthase